MVTGPRPPQSLSRGRQQLETAIEVLAMVAKRSKWLWALPLFLLLLLSCESKNPLTWEDIDMPLPNGSETSLEELERQWEIWRSWDLDSYYLFYRQMCFCIEGGRLVRARVQDGEVLDVRAVDGRPGAPGLRPTVDRIFGMVHRALEHEVYLLRVHYEPTFGYPDYVEIDYLDGAVDDEIRVQAKVVGLGSLDW